MYMLYHATNSPKIFNDLNDVFEAMKEGWVDAPHKLNSEYIPANVVLENGLPFDKQTTVVNEIKDINEPVKRSKKE